MQFSKKDITQLENIIRRGKHNARVITRARILLLVHKGKSKDAIAGELNIGRSTVQRTRVHYSEDGINRALYDAPRSGQPKKLDDAAEAHLVALACSDPPKGRYRWTLVLLQKRMVTDKKVKSISDVCILRYMKERKIKPWLDLSMDMGKNVVCAGTYA